MNASQTMSLTQEQALKVLVKHAMGTAPHANNGLCPDSVEGAQVRDSECKVCQALNVLAEDSLNEQIVMMPKLLPLPGLSFGLDLQTMSMVRGQ